MRREEDLSSLLIRIKKTRTRFTRILCSTCLVKISISLSISMDSDSFHPKTLKVSIELKFGWTLTRTILRC